MSNEKRYTFGGLTVSDLAQHGDNCTKQLARDLLAAQRECQRWAQWAADVSGADVRLSNDELMDQVSIKVCNQRALIAELEAERDAAFDAGRGVGRAEVCKYSRAIGDIEAVLGIAGARPMRETTDAVRAVVAQLAASEATIARVRDLCRRWSSNADTHRVCQAGAMHALAEGFHEGAGDIYTGCVASLEAALKGTSCE